MQQLMTHTDELGPEKVVHLYDPITKMKGVVVIDATPNTFIAAGGIRMLPDITTEEIADLARAMTYKMNTLGIPVGGAKAGIWADPLLKGEERKKLMHAFGHAVKSLVNSMEVSFGADVGTNTTDLEYIREGAGAENMSSGLLDEKIDGELIENYSTGYGVAVAAKSACEFAGLDINGASVAIEGFGKAAGGTAHYISEMGANVVALSTIDGMIYNENGLDIPELMKERKIKGDKAVQEYHNAKPFPREELFKLPVDILIPGARQHVINEKNVSQIQARVISSIANNPICDFSEEILFQKGVHIVPDFISNAGGVVTMSLDTLGGTSEQLFNTLDNLIGSITKEILAAARDANINPRKLAIQRSTEKVLSAQKNKKTLSLEEALEVSKKILMI